MGRIKSAVEIALERTGDIKGDRGAIEQFEAKQRAKKTANDFLEGRETSLEEFIKKTPLDQRKSFREGLLDVFLAQVTLPPEEKDLKKIETAGRGLQAIIRDSKFNNLFRQFLQILRRYVEEGRQYEEAIIHQYAPRLKQKEEELARRLGTPVKLNPFQDPEFVAFFNQHMNTLKAKYEGSVIHVREEAERMFREE
jgi:hypothetical protein